MEADIAIEQVFRIISQALRTYHNISMLSLAYVHTLGFGLLAGHGCINYCSPNSQKGTRCGINTFLAINMIYDRYNLLSSLF